MNKLSKDIEKITTVKVQPAYRIHVPAGDARYHLFAMRKKKIWRAYCDRLVLNATWIDGSDNSFELHEHYVNSLFSAEEIKVLREYFLQKFRVEIGVALQRFPLPLPHAYYGIESTDNPDDLRLYEVGNFKKELPVALLALLYHAVGETSEMWPGFEFDEDFVASKRFEIITKSFVLTPQSNGLPLDIKLLGFAESGGICFLDKLKRVHTKIKSYLDSEREAAEA